MILTTFKEGFFVGLGFWLANVILDLILNTGIKIYNVIKLLLSIKIQPL